ncbi:MAG: carbohydrate-binding family 9-like protein [Halobacteriaceae archaeon]
MSEYRVARAEGGAPLTGDVAGTAWERAAVAPIRTFPWDTGGDRQGATARALYDERALYLQYQVEDAHSVAETTDLNGPVWEDSAVECFARPGPDAGGYFNFEANCAGTFLLGWGTGREDRTRVPADLASAVRVETSVEGPTKRPGADDGSWWLAAELPFETLAAFTGEAVAPDAGTRWAGNFQRLGGGSELAVWNRIDAPEPEFHRPESFGTFAFE